MGVESIQSTIIKISPLAKFLRPGVFAPPISFRPVVGAVLMWGEEEIREFAMLIVRYNIINGI